MLYVAAATRYDALCRPVHRGGGTAMASSTQPRTRESIDELLHQSHYRPEQLAELLGMSLYQIMHEIHEHRLRAFIVDHHVLDIRREDVVVWLEARR
jgi:hypothetical protein